MTARAGDVMGEVRAVLATHWGIAGDRASVELTALAGASGRTFLATDRTGVTGPTPVVVRLDAAVAVLHRVAEIGVGPPVLEAGVVAGRPFVVQPFAGAPVDARWIAAHHQEVGALVATYQADEALANLATELTARRFARSLLADADGLPVALKTSAAALARRLVAAADALERVTSVASHGDPNFSNLLFGDRLWLIDWDDVRRADPLRDLGPLAWWYLPADAWATFLAATGLSPTPAALDRLFWWIGAESLDVACRLASADPTEAAAFIEDARAALDREPNPRQT